MQLRVEPRAARQHERPQGRQALVRPIHLRFQLRDFRLGNPRLPRMHIRGQRGQDGSQVEQLVLHAQQHAAQRGKFQMGRVVRGGFARQAHKRVQLVHRAVGLDAQGILGHALPARQAGFTGVARARVDAVDGQTRRLELKLEFRLHACRIHRARSSLL